MQQNRRMLLDTPSYFAIKTSICFSQFSELKIGVSRKFELQWNSIYPNAASPDRLRPSGKFVENSEKINCLEITDYWIKYSTELHIRCGRKV